MTNRPSRSFAVPVVSALTGAVAALAVVAATWTLPERVEVDAASESRPSATAPSATVDAEFEARLRDYLLANPQVIVDALDVYQRQQDEIQRQALARAIVEQAGELFSRPGSPVIGNAEGDVTLVEFFDYQCGFCKRMEPARRTLLETDPGLRIVLKEYPILGPVSVVAARASLASVKQGRYEPFHDELMAFRGRLEEATIFEIAERVGLDVVQLRLDMEDPAIAAEIDANMKLADTIGISGTPSYVVGDQLIRGAVGLEALQAAIQSDRSS